MVLVRCLNSAVVCSCLQLFAVLSQFFIDFDEYLIDPKSNNVPNIRTDFEAP